MKKSRDEAIPSVRGFTSAAQLFTLLLQAHVGAHFRVADVGLTIMGTAKSCNEGLGFWAKYCRAEILLKTWEGLSGRGSPRTLSGEGVGFLNCSQGLALLFAHVCVYAVFDVRVYAGR